MLILDILKADMLSALASGHDRKAAAILARIRALRASAASL